MLHELNSGNDFLLTKWYLDGVSEEGIAFIGYAAHLRWKVLSLWYSSFNLHEDGKNIYSNYTLKQNSFPSTYCSKIYWSSDALKLEGEWNALSAPIDWQLYKGSDGGILWSCLQPSARCSINIGKNHQLEGLGYVECMTLSIPPWQLPINELRWGRFLTGTDALVWIDWKGTAPLSLLFMNGSQISNCLIKDDDILGDGDNLRVHLQNSVILRNGPLLTTSLSIIPGVKNIFPAKILNTNECKWRSRGHLISEGLEKAAGWAIHENVIF